jgi:RNA polymerase sigma factor (sigma-70 family)
MPHSDDTVQPGRTITYCVVPRDLADELHELLRRHFGSVPQVRVVVEQRCTRRRTRGERRVGGAAPAEDRRSIRAADGRRVADRRAVPVVVDGLGPLPRRARPHAGRLGFVERIEPGLQVLEDRDTDRLVVRIHAGEGGAFAELYMRYFDRVYAYVKMVSRDAHEAEDLTQQVFMRLLEVIDDYERRPGKPFRAWLFTVARNVAISELRRNRRVSAVDPVDLATQRIASTEDGSELRSLDWVSDHDLLMLIERLPLAQRQVFFLRFVLDLAYSDIAAILDRSLEDVRSLQSRGVRFLRDRLAKLGRPAADHPPIRSRGCLRRSRVLHGRRWSLTA